VNHLKNVERALIATGVALVFSGGIASAAILWTSATAAAAQPSGAYQLAAQLGTYPGTLADNGPKGGADLMAAAAAYIGISAADLKTQLASGTSLADIAVANGKTRDGLIAALVAAEQQALGTFVDQKGFPSAGRPGVDHMGGRGPFGLGAQGDPLATAATFLGTTTADLRTKMESGQSLAQVATAAGKTRDALVQALVADATTKIEAAKTAGTITADQATKLETGLADRLGKLVDSTDTHGPGPRR
jgi:lambda repressor-like predicted transcriptional regulator